jgi:choloylglycine hydrolase
MALSCCLVVFALLARGASACTGISLTSTDADKTVVAARTNEWSGANQQMRVHLFHRGKQFEARTPAGPGKSWTGKHGFLSQTAFGQPYGPDGMNEHGLYCGMFMLSGDMHAKTFNKDEHSRSLSVGDFMQWVLSQFKTIAEVREQLELPDTQREYSIFDMVDPRFKDANKLHFHWKFADQTGDSFVFEIVNGGDHRIYNTSEYYGAVANQPTYDFHIRNLESYSHLLHDGEGHNVGETGLGRKFAFGLPGDFKSPGRFVRAWHYARTARLTHGAADTVQEAFRILNNFDIPLGTVVPQELHVAGTVGATQVTSVADLSNQVYYYKTMYNHRIRKVELARIHWAAIKEDVSWAMDEVNKDDYLDVTPTVDGDGVVLVQLNARVATSREAL